MFILMSDSDYVINHLVTGTGSLVLIDGSIGKLVVELLWIVV